MVQDINERCPTGIAGFDTITQGGFIRNSDNVLIGGPGSGKTTFLLQFLWNGATKYDENGIYCSFEPDIIETIKDSQAHGWDFSKLNEENKVKFLKFSPHTTIEELKGELTKLISKYGCKRICFDPVSVLALNLSEEGKIRETIFELSSLMKRFNVTTIYADESMENDNAIGNTKWSKTDIIQFLADSVTVLHETGIAGTSDRAIRITKMRRTQHERRPLPMTINENGIQVTNSQPPQNQQMYQPPQE